MSRRTSRPASPAGSRSGGGAPRLGPASAVGVDTGGTFTDFVAVRAGQLIALKLPSTPAAPERAVLRGLRRLAADRRTAVRHGSTVATNTLLERKGARVTLLTTAGFEDLIEIGRQERPEIYALRSRRGEPLVPPERRVGVAERIGPGGETWQALAIGEVRRAVALARGTRPEAIAIGLLHSFSHPAHERRLEAALAGLGVPVTRSSALCPEFREYERIATTVTNAYLAPRVGRYVRSLARGTAARVEIVLSHGGTAPPEVAAREAVRQLLSGPAAGLRAAAGAAKACGFARAITLDVGGTSSDCAFVAGEPPRSRGREVAGFPVQLPLLDVHTVGAGGGSIAEVDEGGLLVVGPRSAGAVPGPACYGRGGPATVTDAFVTLGMIPIETLAGGAIRLDRAAARRSLERLGAGLGGLTAEAAGEAVLTIAGARIEAALRRVSVERGHDPRDAALVAFGGAGGLHACALAEALGCPAVLWPRHAGVLSALGALEGGSRRERSRTVLLPAGEDAAIDAAFGRLAAEVLSEFPAASRRAVGLERWAQMRFIGQSHEIEVGAAAGAGGLDAVFRTGHRERYGFEPAGGVVEVVSIEVRGSLPAGELPAPAPPEPGGPTRPASSRAWWQGRWRAVSVWARGALAPRASVTGPAVVLDEGATLWIPAGWRARTHATGALVVTRSGRR